MYYGSALAAYSVHSYINFHCTITVVATEAVTNDIGRVTAQTSVAVVTISGYGWNN